MTDLDIFVTLYGFVRMKQHEIVKCLFRLQKDPYAV